MPAFQPPAQRKEQQAGKPRLLPTFKRVLYAALAPPLPTVPTPGHADALRPPEAPLLTLCPADLSLQGLETASCCVLSPVSPADPCWLLQHGHLTPGVAASVTAIKPSVSQMPFCTLPPQSTLQGPHWITFLI